MVQWFPIAIGRLKVTFCGKGRMGPGRSLASLGMTAPPIAIGAIGTFFLEG